MNTKTQQMIEILGGLTETAKLVDRHVTAVFRWKSHGYLPATELNGLTAYAPKLARAARERGMQITADELRAETMAAIHAKFGEKR